MYAVISLFGYLGPTNGLPCAFLQVDLISFQGPMFEHVDNRVAALRLVQKGLCDAALFDPSGTYGHVGLQQIYVLRVDRSSCLSGSALV